MITPEEIKKKAERKYTAFLQSVVAQVPFEKMPIPSDKSYTKSSLAAFEKEIQLLVSQSKEKKGFGYTLAFQEVRTKYVGTQHVPVSIYFETEEDYLRFLGKEREVKQFRQCSLEIMKTFPELKEWIFYNPIKIIDKLSEWEGILKVCKYFKHNPIPNLYIRELPIRVDTKFIERNQGIIRELLDFLISNYIQANEKIFEKRFNLRYAEPQIRFKVLDKEFSQHFFSGIDDLAIPVSQFEMLNLPIETAIVLENKTTFYTALTLPKLRKTIALFGSGFSVHNLKHVNWFENKKILYWGDLDAQGFEILSQFRSYFPHTRSILMDARTFEQFFENDSGTVSNISTPLNLTEDEQALYDRLRMNNWRLEQEKIPFEYVNQYLDQV